MVKEEISNPLPETVILSVPISRLTKADAGITAALLSAIIKQVPAYGKEEATYFIINPDLGLNNPNHEKRLEVLNAFVLLSTRSKYKHIMLTKD